MKMKCCTLICLVIVAMEICALEAQEQEQFHPKEPRDSATTLNNSLTMECFMKQAEIKCDWLFNGAIMQLDERYVYNENTLDGNCPLVIKSVTLDDDGTYQCQYQTNNGTVTSRPAKLTVLHAPEAPIINYMGNETKHGENIFLPDTKDFTFSISCYSRHGNPAPTLRWFAQYEPEGRVECIPEEVIPLQTTTNTLDLTVNDALAMKTIHCSAEHRTWGSETRKVSVNFITGAPTTEVVAVFSETSETTVMAPSGSSVTLGCTGNGNPIPLYRWEMQKGNEEANHIWEHVAYDANVSVKTPSGITAYRCNAKNHYNNNTYINSEKIILKSSACRFCSGQFVVMLGIALIIALMRSW